MRFRGLVTIIAVVVAMGASVVGAAVSASGGSGTPTPTPVATPTAAALVAGEGAAVHGAAAWNAAGFRGQGVKVGVIDFGGSGFSGYAELMGWELPPSVKARCYVDGDEGAFTSELADCATGGGTHGTRMAEAIADIAPEMSPYVARPYLPSELMDTVRWMVGEEVDVIVYPISWIWDGPGDGSSPAPNSPLRAVDLAVANNILWVSSVGNWAKDAWFGGFADADGDGRHEFAPDAECNDLVKTEVGRTIIAQLRWNGDWGGAATDLDLRVYERVGGELELRASSGAAQGGGPEDNPYEIVRYAPESGGEHCLAVHHIGGVAPEWVQMLSLRREGLRHHTLEGSVRTPGESANPGMLTVGAARWQTPEELEADSGRGPTPDGRVKPDIVGAHGANSATAGPWFGTGQAAAHVAGLAALVRQRFPDYTPERVADYLKASASPRGGDTPNNGWGYGFAQLPPVDAAGQSSQSGSSGQSGASAPGGESADAAMPETGGARVSAWVALGLAALGVGLVAGGAVAAARGRGASSVK